MRCTIFVLTRLFERNQDPENCRRMVCNVVLRSLVPHFKVAYTYEYHLILFEAVDFQVGQNVQRITEMKSH